MAEETQEKIGQLQIYEQSLQNLLLQKQQFQAQITEIDSALKEMEGSNETYKIVGNIMIKSGKEGLLKDLESKKSTVGMRIKALEKQESSIKEKVESIRKEVMEEMQKKE